MGSRSRNVPLDQPGLAFDATDGVQPQAALRAAFRRLRMSHRLSFEQAMANRTLAICLHNLAEAMAEGPARPRAPRTAALFH